MIRPIVSMDEVILMQDEINTYTFNLFPNPANKELNITSSSIDNLISIYNLKGELVKQTFFHNNNYRLNINNLSSGIYVVEVKNNKFRNFQKFIIK